MKCVENHGLQNYKDMWYGVEAYNWKIEPRSKYFFDELKRQNYKINFILPND